jgi:glycosyltransferase involved in cell wall biosynthesis
VLFRSIQKQTSSQETAIAQKHNASHSVSSISVIIPTCNRAASIERTLHSLVVLQNPGCPFEIIVVDNGSTDTTRQTVELFRHRLADLKYIYEPNTGLHNGRHRGAFEAKGQILCYLDDDVKVDPGWLCAIRETFETTDAVIVGGKILPEYEQTPPDWVKQFIQPVGDYGYSIGQLTLIDLGEQIREIDPIYVWGANFSIRKDTLFECGGFHPDSMPKELIYLRGDGETGLSLAIREKGYKAVYHPAALVRHCISKDRLTRQYFDTRMFNQGISDSFTEIRRSGKVNMLAPSAALDACQKGKLFHQQQVQSNPQLLSWVLRKDYYSDIKTQTPASLSPQVRYELHSDPAVPV